MREILFYLISLVLVYYGTLALVGDFLVRGWFWDGVLFVVVFNSLANIPNLIWKYIKARPQDPQGTK